MTKSIWWFVSALVAIPVGMIVLVLTLGGAGSAPEDAQASANEHAGEGSESSTDSHEGEEAEAPKPLSQEQMAEAGIVVEALSKASLPRVFPAPGEIQLNDYTSSIVSPRVGGAIVKRHVKLGDTVRTGQPLVRIFSVAMAEAESAFILASQEFKRVEGAGRDVVSGKRYDEARIALQEARTRLQTYGLPEEQIDLIAANGSAGSDAGEFDLLAPQDGVIVTEDVRIGEVVEPGKRVMEIGDGKTVWIDARVSPDTAVLVKGEEARFFAAEQAYDARVIQIEQKLNEETRTIGVRLEADNAQGLLKPGIFVDVHLYGDKEAVLAVPTEAVLRSADGDWSVHVETAPGVFESKEIEVLYAVDEMTAIDGLAEGTRIAVKGAFFIAAEAAKGGFDPHGH